MTTVDSPSPAGDRPSAPETGPMRAAELAAQIVDAQAQLAALPPTVLFETAVALEVQRLAIKDAANRKYQAGQLTKEQVVAELAQDSRLLGQVVALWRLLPQSLSERVFGEAETLFDQSKQHSSTS